MADLNLRFRAAQPSDAPIAAKLIQSAAPEFFGYIFAPDPGQVPLFLQRMFACGSGMFGFQRYTVATIDEQVVAIGAFYDSTQRPKPDHHLLWNLIYCFDPISFVGIAKRAISLASLAGHGAADSEFFANIAVTETMRGHGIGTALLQRQIDWASATGHKKCALNVSVSNPTAQRLYERLGFRVVAERQAANVPKAMRPPDLRYMELEL